MAVKNKGAAAPKKKVTRYCVYLGPSIRGVIMYGTTIPGKHEEACNAYAAAIERFPKIRNLIVADTELGAGLRNIKKSGTALYEFNRKFIAELSRK